MSLSVLRVAAALLRRAPLGFVLVLLSAWVGAEAVTPEITDTDYHIRLRMIRAATAEHPDLPIGLTLGSSRTVWGFRPEELPEQPEPGDVISGVTASAP